MPLMKRRSQKAFEHNIEAEMHAGKPQKQALAIAYSVKRKAKKADGGQVEPDPQPSPTPDPSMKAKKMLAPVKKYVDTHTDGGPGYADGGKLKALKRPSTIPFYEKAEKHITGEGQEYTPGQGEISTRMRKIDRDTGEYEMHGPKKGKLQGLYDGGMVDTNDRASISRNSSKHAPMRGDDAKTQDDTSYQDKKGMKTTKIKHPKMVHSDVIKARLRDEEDDLMMSAHPASPDEQPAEHMNEERPDRKGPRVPDMQDSHSTHRKPYAKGGEIESSDEHIRADGRYEDDLQDLPPSEDEGRGMAMRENEMGPDRQGPAIPDMEEPHSEHDEMYHDNMHDDSTEDSDTMGRSASGGMDQPEDEAEEMHAASLAAAVMARRKKMARGGEIIHDSEEPLSHGSMDSDDSDMADLSRNAEEDANEEDQASFDALRKENYSDSEGLRHMDSPEDSNEHEPEHEEMDIHDRSVVGQIRSKMRKKSAITR